MARRPQAGTLKRGDGMFNFLLFYYFCIKSGIAGGRFGTKGLGFMLLLLILRYILTSIFLLAAWREYEDGNPLLPFLPVLRYYCYGSLAGFRWSGPAACAAAAFWLIGILSMHGSAAVALNSCVVFFANASCAWGFADRAEANRFLSVLFSVIGLPWLSVLYVLGADRAA